jgi:hypothetical protein
MNTHAQDVELVFKKYEYLVSLVDKTSVSALKSAPVISEAAMV